MKALYLDGRSGLNVKLDGPALRVHRWGRADGQFPLLRVARVVAVGRVHWQPEALNACMFEQKPVVVLDNQGRFERLLFRLSAPQYGLARHLGELLGVARFRRRYEAWFQMSERAEMLAAVRRLALGCREMHPDQAWQMVCREQHRRRRVCVGHCYRYLLGLATAQIASAFAVIGLPRDAQNWQRQEYRLFCDTVRLERWRQSLLLEQLLERNIGFPTRRDLTAAFEEVSDERERRIASWRQRALLAMMGVRVDEGEMSGLEGFDRQSQAGELSQALMRLCHKRLNGSGNWGRIPFGMPGSFRSSVRILRDYLEYDRRTYESYGAA